MDTLPSAIFIIDCKKEKIAISEAKKLGMPTVAIVDTNCDPDDIDYVIPGNDDAIRTIRLVTSRLADAALEGMHERQAAFSDDVAVASEALSPQESIILHSATDPVPSTSASSALDTAEMSTTTPVAESASTERLPSE